MVFSSGKMTFHYQRCVPLDVPGGKGELEGGGCGVKKIEFLIFIFNAFFFAGVWGGVRRKISF